MRKSVVWLALLAALLAAGCSGTSGSAEAEAKLLFSLGYGGGLDRVDIASSDSPGACLVQREGIFHFLDKGGRKVLRLSAYGDIIAALYDPRYTAIPSGYGFVSESQAGESFGGEPLSGRYAEPAEFVSPQFIEVDSRQTLYVVDRLSPTSGRSFDPALEVYVDHVVRRFLAGGREAGYVGQEGLGGTPFPYVTGLKALSDDSLVVISRTESLFMVSRYDSGGTLLSTLKLKQDDLPVPSGLMADAADEAGSRNRIVHANLDSIDACLSEKGFSVLAKLDYYSETFAAPSEVDEGVHLSGSWVFEFDGTTGSPLASVDLGAAGDERNPPELVHADGKYLYLLDSENGKERLRSEGESPSYLTLLKIDRSGKVDASDRLALPSGTFTMLDFDMSDSGHAFAAFERDAEVAVAQWSLE